MSGAPPILNRSPEAKVTDTRSAEWAPMEYDAVVFDNDGVLTHLTNWDIIREAIRETFAEFDVDPADGHVEDALRGEPDRLHWLADHHGFDPERFWARREARAAAVQRAAMEAGQKPLYDDCAVLRRLRVRHGLSLGIVSNNQHETVQHVLDVHEIEELFGTAYGREPTVAGTRRKKPDPHYLNCALTDLNADSALYVGDSASDILAAENAGIDSVFLRRPHRHEYTLSVDPTHELTSLRELPDVL